MENKTIAIQKLNGSNFYIWKFKIELVLQRDKLWGTLSQDPPTTLIDEWVVRDQAAKATICLSIEDNLLINIRHCSTAKETWNTLLKLYEHPSLSTKLHLLRKLYGTRYEHYNDMKDFINAIMELTGQLKSIGENINDKNIIAILLCGLPGEYNNLITAVESKEEDTLTIDYVKHKLFEESSRRENYSNHVPESLAMPTVKNQQRSNYSIICYECGKPGHTRRDCGNRDYQRRWIPPRSTNYNNQNDYPRKTQPNYSGNTVMSSTEEINETPFTYQNHEEIDEVKACCKCSNKEEEKYTALSGAVGDVPKNWILDSGASAHMTPFKNFFQNIVYLKTKIPITLANGCTVFAEGKGSGLVNLCNDINKNDIVKICDVLYVPSLQFQLLSIKQLCKRGHNVSFSIEGCKVRSNNSVIATASLDGGTFILDEINKSEPIVSTSCIHLWHKRMGHRSNDTLSKMSKDNLTHNFHINSCKHPDFCKICQLCKMKQTSFKPSNKPIEKPFQTIVTDVCGPMQVASLGGSYYILTIADSFSRFLHTDMLKQKSQVPEKLISYIEKGHNQFGYYPNILRSDGGGEYRNQVLDKYLDNHGIVHQIIVPYAPQQNGQAERVNSTIMNMTRCLLKESHLPMNLWAEAAGTATHIINRIAHSSTGKTPFELWYNSKPDLKNLKTFGCRAYAFTPKVLRRKLDDTSTEGFFVGYGLHTKGYRMWITGTNKVVTTAKMTFNEKEFYKPTSCDLQNSDHQTQINSMEFPLLIEEENHDDIPISLRRSTRETRGIPAVKLTY